MLGVPEDNVPRPLSSACRFESLPVLGSGAWAYAANGNPFRVPHSTCENPQHESCWSQEAATIAATVRRITWRSPSRHESAKNDPRTPSEDEVYVDNLGASNFPGDGSDSASANSSIQGGRIRGMLLHKLIEEVLTGETLESTECLVARATKLLAELDIAEAKCPQEGPHTPELAATTLRAFAIPEVAALKPRLVPEIAVLLAETSGTTTAFIGGVADALALGEDGSPEVVVEWKSDVAPDSAQIALYRDQVRDYLVATGASEGLLVFATTGTAERISRPSVNVRSSTFLTRRAA